MQNYKQFTKPVDQDLSINILDKSNYLLSPVFHHRLSEGYGKNTSHQLMITKGVYLVKFGIIKNSDKTELVYHYTYYTPSLCVSLVVYFILRNFYLKGVLNGIGNYFVVLNNKFLNIENMEHYIKPINGKKSMNTM